MSTTNMANMAEKCQQIAKTMEHFHFPVFQSLILGLKIMEYIVPKI